MDFTYHSRSYDDEDAALQAALKASMEDVPKGWVAPELPVKRGEKKREEPAQAAMQAQVAPSVAPPAMGEVAKGAAKSGNEVVEEDEDDDVPAEALTAGEFATSVHLSVADAFQTRFVDDDWRDLVKTDL
jgi:ataxin-3